MTARRPSSQVVLAEAEEGEEAKATEDLELLADFGANVAIAGGRWAKWVSSA